MDIDGARAEPNPAPRARVDAGTFAEVYRVHSTFVYANLLRLGVPRAAVDDALQDVFVVVHRRLAEFEGRSSVRSWVFGILRRVAFRYRRSAERAGAKARALTDEPQPDPGASDVFDRHQRAALLARALDELDEDKRVAITLHVFEDLSGPELAALLGVNLDTAYSRIKAARRDLQRALVQIGAGADERELVAAMRRATTPDRASRRRAAALVAARVGVDAGTLGASFVGLKSVIAALVIGAGATVAIAAPRGPDGAAPVRAVGRADEPASASAARTVDAVPVPAEYEPLPPSAAAEVPPPTVALPSRPRLRADEDPVDTPATSTTADETLRAEVVLVTSAKRALDAGDPQRTLDHLAEHGRTFPQGQLATERAGYRAAALCELGRTTQGRGEAKVFLAAHPAASIAARVATACELAAPATAEKIAPQ